MNQQIDTILVPLEIGEGAGAITAWAADWARMKRARLIFLHVLPQVNAYATPVFVEQGRYDEYYARARDHATAELQHLAAAARAAGLDVSTTTRVGAAAEEILSAAREMRADLIVLGTHGRRGLAHLVLGSTAEKVVRLADCPVFVAKAKQPAPGEPAGAREAAHAGR